MKRSIAVVIVICLLVGTYLLGKLLAPMEVDYLQWITFVFWIAVSVPCFSVVAYLIYAVFSYKAVKLRQYTDVFRLFRPWLATLGALFFLQVVFGIVSGLILVTDRTIFGFTRVLLVACIAGVVDILTYWKILPQVFGLPTRVRYVPSIVFRVR